MSGDGRLKIKNALISVSDKSGLEELITSLNQNNVSIFSYSTMAENPHYWRKLRRYF